MDRVSPLMDKSFAFAVNIVFFCFELQKQKEYVLSKQLLRSGTSIGANIEEATQGQSRNDFISKLSIALKEAYETRYWLRLLNATKLGDKKKIDQFIIDVNEIIRMLVASIKTAKSRN